MNISKSAVSLIFLSLLITTNLFVFSKQNLSLLSANPWLTGSQITALWGTVLLCFSYILSSKIKWIEHVFGSMDSLLRLHAITAMIAFVLLIQHPILLIIRTINVAETAILYILPSSNIAYTNGIIAIWLMIGLVITAHLIKLPYQLWLKMHSMMAVVIFFTLLHVWLIPSDTSRYLPLRIWMLSWISLAFFSWVYAKYLFWWLGPQFKYQIESIARKGDIFDIILKPLGKTISHKAGQFAYFQVQHPDFPDEIHPFSIASMPSDEHLRICIKMLGDYTLKLSALKPGTSIKIWGPFGRFMDHAHTFPKLYAIGGGIGITPMLSLQNINPDLQINIWHIVKSSTDSLVNIHQSNSNIKLHSHISSIQGRFNVDHLGISNQDVKTAGFYLCGPESMMYSLANQLQQKGVSPRRIFYESFSFTD